MLQLTSSNRSASTETLSDPLLDLAANALGVECFLAAIAIAAACLMRAPLRETLGLTPSRFSARTVAILTIGILALSHALDASLANTPWQSSSALAELMRLLASARGTQFVLVVFTIGLLPAIAEELLCRGLLQRLLVERFGPAPGIIGSALVFGALHIDPVHVVLATGLGLYLGLITHWAGSIRPAMVCHGVNNIAAVVGAAYWDSAVGSLASLSAGYAIAAAVLVWAHKRATSEASTAPCF